MLSKHLKEFIGVDVSQMRAREFLARQREMERIKLEGIELHSGWKPVVACPVCGSRESEPALEKNGVQMVRCRECSLRYHLRVPFDLGDIYRSPDYKSFSLDDTVEHFAYRRDRFGRERLSILERHCGDLGQKKLLDVGCGNGYFLAVAKEKCGACYGTEFSDRLRTFAIDATGLTIFDKDIDEIPEKGFDIVTLFDVIEHLPDPLGFLRKVDSILNPGGHLLVFTPNFDSLSIRVMGARSSIVDPTEHLVLFTLPALEDLGRRLGYRTVYRETRGMDVQNILALYHDQGIAADRFLVDWGNELQAVVDASESADYARILYRKVNGESRWPD